MKKVLVFLLTAALLVSTISFAAMVIPSETSPNPLSAVDDTSDGYYGQLNILPEDSTVTSNGATSGALIYNNYLVVPSVFYSIYNNDRNRLTVYDLSLNDPVEIVSWNLGEMGVPYYPTSDTDSTPIANNFKQNTIYGLEMDSEYIYLVAAYNYKPYLYIFTNPLNGELSYDDEGQPVVETPELVSGPTMIANGCTNVDQVWTLNRLPYIKKIGNYITGKMEFNENGELDSKLGKTISLKAPTEGNKSNYGFLTKQKIESLTLNEDTGKRSYTFEITDGTKSYSKTIEFDNIYNGNARLGIGITNVPEGIALEVK